MTPPFSVQTNLYFSLRDFSPMHIQVCCNFKVEKKSFQILGGWFLLGIGRDVVVLVDVVELVDED